MSNAKVNFVGPMYKYGQDTKNPLICFIKKEDYLIKVYKHFNSDWQVIMFKDNRKVSECWFSQWSANASGSLYRAITAVY